MTKKMFKKVFGTMLAVCLLCGSLSGVVLAEKTYTDAEKWDFETNEGWNLANGAQADVHVFYNTDEAYVLKGNRSLKITGDAQKEYVGVYMSYQEVAEGSGKTQYVTGKIKADLDEGSQLEVAMLDGYATASARRVVSYEFTEDCDWTDILLQSAVQAYNGGTLYIIIWLTGTGTVYADDFALVEDDNMTVNPTFLPDPLGDRPSGWITQSSRGSWGKEWWYDATYGALKRLKTSNSWDYLYMRAPYANKMENGEMYKFSIRYKDVNDKKTPGLYVAYDNGKFTGPDEIKLSAVGGPDENGFTQYVGYFTMPADKEHFGYYINGESSTAEYFDDFYVVKDETSTPFVSDADGDDTIEAGESVTAKMHFAEKEEKSVQMIIAVYSRSGNAKVLEAVNIVNYDIEAGVPADKEVSVAVPAEDKTYTAKAFCWDADDLLTLLP